MQLSSERAKACNQAPGASQTCSAKTRESVGVAPRVPRPKRENATAASGKYSLTCSSTTLDKITGLEGFVKLGSSTSVDAAFVAAVAAFKTLRGAVKANVQRREEQRVALDQVFAGWADVVA